MATGPDPTPHTLDGKVLGDEHHVQDLRVTRGVCGVDQVEFGGCENTVSAMKDSPSSISLALVSAAMRAAS